MAKAKEMSLILFLKMKKIIIIIIKSDNNILLKSISSASNKFLSAIIIDLKFPEKILQIRNVKLIITPTSAAKE